MYQSPNPLLIVIIIVAVPLIAWGLVGAIFHWRFKHAIYARQDLAPRWETRFPDAMSVVDRALTIFCEAFLLKGRYRYHLRPDDRIMEIYRDTTGPLADEMQLETLTMRIRDAFDVDLSETLNQDTTLADVLDAVLNMSNSGPDTPISTPYSGDG